MGERRWLTAAGALTLVERVLRGGHNVFFELLEQAADNVVIAAELLHGLLADFPDGAERAAAIAECEHRGDGITREVIDRLNREVAAPIEREDLLALTSALDDIVDLVDEVAAYLSIYCVDAPMIQAEALAHVLVDAARVLAAAVHRLASFEDIAEHVVEVHRLENEGDQLVRDAVASLFEHRIDPMVVIRWKDIFERLEDAIDSTERAAYVLEGVVIKHMSVDVILVIVVVTALAFDFTNGFHDTANVVATSISTRAIGPRRAVAIASVLNFAGAFISLRVADTVGQGFVDTHVVTTTVVFAGLVGAITWNLMTWYLGLPSSSSHALIGGLVGAVVAAEGWSAVSGQGLVTKLIVPAIVSPLVAFVAAWLSVLLVYRIVRSARPGGVSRGFKLGQVVSGGLLALSHGTNDAQKTMGVITLALVASGKLSATNFHVPVWVVIAAATAISLGTFTGGWRIIKTMGTKIISMDPAQGFVAQTAGAAVILAASHSGYPLSTTHVISGGITGAGAAKRLSAVRWGVAREIVIAWILTLPSAALVGAAVYVIANLFGHGDAGPIALSVVLAIGVLAVFLGARGGRGQTRVRHGATSLEATHP